MEQLQNNMLQQYNNKRDNYLKAILNEPFTKNVSTKQKWGLKFSSSFLNPANLSKKVKKNIEFNQQKN